MERTFKMATSCHIYKETLQEELGKGRSCFAWCFVYCFIMRNSFCLTWPAKTLGKFAVYIAVCCCLYWCVCWCVCMCCLCVVLACVEHFALLLCFAIALNLCFIASFPLSIRTHQKGAPKSAPAPPPSDFVCHCALCLMLCKLLPWLLFAIRFRARNELLCAFLGPGRTST